MSYKANYFKIGLFIVVGAGISLAVVIGLGTTALFEETVTVETYFDESVQGLSVGSPVKYRGVAVGSVERILFTYNKYQQGIPFAERKPYVLVEFGVAPEGFGSGPRPGAVVLNSLVDRGLRVTLAQQGLTGLCYLELDFIRDPGTYERLETPWHPPAYYIPSHPSAIAQIGDSFHSVAETVDKINEVPFDEIGKQVSMLLASLNKISEDPKISHALENAVAMFDDAAVAARSIRRFVEAPEVKELRDDLAAGIGKGRDLLEKLDAEAPAALADLKAAMAKLNEAAGKAEALLADEALKAALSDAAEGASGVKDAAKDLPQLVADLRATLKAARRVVQLGEQDIEKLMGDLRAAAESLRRTSEEAAENPSRVIFGEPPTPFQGEQE